MHLHVRRTFSDALAVVQESGARVTVPGRMGLVTAAGAQRMAVLQPAVLAVAGRPAPVVGATLIGTPFVAPPVLVVADYVRFVGNTVRDLAPINRRRVAQFYGTKNETPVTDMMMARGGGRQSRRPTAT